MSAQPKGHPGAPPEEAQSDWTAFFTPKRIRMILIGSLVLLVAVTAFFVWRGIEDEAADEVFDEYYALRKDNEPSQDPLWEDPFGVYAAGRSSYISALEKFLDTRVAKTGGVLEPQVRWRIARTLADHLLAMKDVLDVDKRAPHYEKAIAQLETIRDQHPDFPLNWEMFSGPNFPSLTREFLAWFEANRDWEEKYLPREKAPDGAHTLVLRTTRGDLRMKLYEKDAPTYSKNLITRALAGAYDGTALIEKRAIGDALAPRESSVRGGSAASRDATAHEWDKLDEMLQTSSGGGMLPEETRNLIPFTRGIVAAWHNPATLYDTEEALLFVKARSPSLDYVFTPIGKLVDDKSLETLDRIYDAPTWRDDPQVREETAARSVLDAFQVPVVIRKVLVFDAGGALLEPAASDRMKNKADADASEKTLSGLAPDAYLVEAPKRPVVGGSDDDDAGSDDGATDGAGNDGDG